jgi:hypothetical protein
VFFFFLAVCISALAGLRATADARSFGWTSESRRYLVGPSAEEGMLLGFGFEVDAVCSVR